MSDLDRGNRPDLLCPDCGHHLHRPNPGKCQWRDCSCADRPTTEPHAHADPCPTCSPEPKTEAGRELLRMHPNDRAYWSQRILAIEAEAAQGAESGYGDVWHYCDFDSPHHRAAQGAAPHDLDCYGKTGLSTCRCSEGAAPLHNHESFACGDDCPNRTDLVRRSEGAAPRAEGLDTVTIPRAEYEALMRYDEGRAAEYARLSRPSDERVPEEER